MMVLQALYENSIKYPDRIAVFCNDEHVTYKELWEYANKFATYLKKQGLTKGDCVVIQGTQNTAFVIILFGTLLSGGAAVPIDESIKHNSFANIINATKSKIIFSRDTLENYTLSGILNLISDISFVEHVLPNENDMSEILFTTGTTGKSEGIIHTFRSQYCAVENKIHLIRDTDNYTAMIIAPLNHAFGLRCLYYHIILGNTSFIQDKIFPLERLFQNIKENNISSIALNPSALAIILNNSEDIFSQFANQIRYMEFSSSPLKIELLKQIMLMLPNSKMYNTYGSTEAGCITGFDNTQCLEAGNIGYANKNSDVYVLDENYNIISGCGKDNAGFLAVKGPIVMQGYLNNQSNTTKVLKNGYYITNDVVYKDEDNFFHLLGRQSDIVSVGGLKVSPDEVEDIIRQYPGIIECAYVGKNDEIAGQVPVLFIVVDECYDAKGLYKYMADKIETYKCPKDIRVIDSLPKTFNGKLIRRKLRELL